MLKKYQKQLIALCGILLLIVLLSFFSGKVIPFIRDVDALQQWLNRFGIFQYLLFILLVSLQVMVAVIPGGPYQIAGGYLYGSFFGSVLCMIGCTIGSLIVFLLVKRYGMKLIRIFISEESLKKTTFITESPKCKWLLTICFLIPGTPKDVISYIAGLTNIKFWQWTLICSLGRLPGIFLSVFAGNAFRKNHATHAILAFCILAIICFIGGCFYQKLSKQNK